MGRKTNSLGYKKGFGTYGKIKRQKGAPVFGTMYLDKYGDRIMTLTLEYYIVVFTSKKSQIFFWMEEHIGNILCTNDCAERILGYSFRAEVKPSEKDRYRSKEGGKWVIPLRFCNESNIEIIGSAKNIIYPENGYSVNLSQPGPPFDFLIIGGNHND